MSNKMMPCLISFVAIVINCSPKGLNGLSPSAPANDPNSNSTNSDQVVNQNPADPSKDENRPGEQMPEQEKDPPTVIVPKGPYKIAGKVRGLSGSLTLQINAGNDLTLKTDGTFEFSQTIHAGEGYSVSIKNQPADQTCVVYNSSGKNVSNDVADVAVNCSEFWLLPQNLSSYNAIGDDHIKSVFVENKKIYVATGNGGVSISQDNGSTWMTRTSANGLGSNSVHDIFATRETLLAATENGLSISTDGGFTWVNKTGPFGTGLRTPRRVFSSDGAIYALSDYGLSISNDTGTTWNTITPPSYYYRFGALKSIFVVGSIIYTATSDNGILVSRNSGMTWDTLSQKGCSSSSVNDLSVSGSKIYAATKDGLCISTDGGSSWLTRTFSNGLENNSIKKVETLGRIVYLATDEGTSISMDDGVTWTNKNVENGLASQTILDVGLSTSTLFAATDKGLSISNNAGLTWETKVKHSPQFENYPNAHSVVVSNGHLYAATEKGVSISLDGGQTWARKTTMHGLASSWIFDVFVSGSMVFAATPGGLSTSANGGITWRTLTTANGLGSDYVMGVFASGDSIYAATAEGLSISYDSGLSWIKKSSTDRLGSNSVLNVSLAGRKMFMTRPDGYLYTSNDLGSSWTIRKFQSHYPPYDDSKARRIRTSGNTLYLQTDDAFYKSVDSGTTWSQIKRCYYFCNRLFLSGERIFAATIEGIYVSIDQGATWSQPKPPIERGGEHTNYVYAVGGSIYATRGVDLGVFVKNPSLPVK